MRAPARREAAAARIRRGSLAVLVLIVLARHRAAIAASALGLLALAFADVAGAGYTSSGETGASMAMAVLTGVALLCYAANLYPAG